jgi:hypothetical protein
VPNVAQDPAPTQADLTFNAEVTGVAKRKCSIPGYRVTLAANGLEELTFFTENPPQVGAAFDVTIKAAAE